MIFVNVRDLFYQFSCDCSESAVKQEPWQLSWREAVWMWCHPELNLHDLETELSERFCLAALCVTGGFMAVNSRLEFPNFSVSF